MRDVCPLCQTAPARPARFVRRADCLRRWSGCDTVRTETNEPNGW